MYIIYIYEIAFNNMWKQSHLESDLLDMAKKPKQKMFKVIILNNASRYVYQHLASVKDYEGG